MQFDGIRVATGALSSLSSRAALAAGVSLLIALTFGAPGQAFAQCVGSYSSSGASGVHAAPSGAANVHSSTSTPHVHTGSASCPTGGTASNTHVHLSSANPTLGSAKPALGGTGHWHSTQHENTHLVKSNSNSVKP